MSETTGLCLLSHRGFLLLQDVAFQRSEADGLPVAVLPLGGRAASVPLRALQRELRIDDDSDDGRMLALIVEALDYVVSLRPGDRLPPEVLTGAASWAPAPRHLDAARQGVNALALAWSAADDLPGAYVALAAALGAATAASVQAMLEALAVELSFIEASRELLLDRVRRLGVRLERLRLDSQPGQRRDELTQSRRLVATAVERIAARFAAVAAQTADIVAALRRGDVLATFIRSNRDWLHRSLLAWSPVLREWEAEAPARAEGRAALVSTTYRFLAPRFMSVQEWRGAQSRRCNPRPEAVFEW